MTSYSMKYKQCVRCVMDTTAKDIQFNQHNICNYCEDFLNDRSKVYTDSFDVKAARLNKLVKEIKLNGEGKPYDCVIGVSGGVDSSWVLVEAKRLGLRPLAVHMDNGWNSELAQNNISNLVRSLEVDLYTHVINWNEYRDLMQAFFDADVIDVELLYDHAMIAVNYKQASRYKLKYILSGTNSATEGFRIPSDWNWFKRDKRNIVSIARSHQVKSFKSFPTIGTKDFLWYHFGRKINWISFLDYFDFNKFTAIEKLESDFNYKRYAYKHYESIFTRFYQGYILPKKFNVDKRKLHLSNLVVTGQLSREKALRQLEEIPYASEKDLDLDIDYFLKKMNWTKQNLSDYINRLERPHTKYKSERQFWNNLKKIQSLFASS